MTATAWALYGPAREAEANGDIDWEADAFKCILLDSGHTPDQTLHDALADISADESANYTRPTVDISVTRSGLVVTLDCPDISVTPSGGNTLAAYAVLYDDTHIDDMPVLYTTLDGGADVTIPDGIPYTIIIHANGLYTFTPATAA